MESTEIEANEQPWCVRNTSKDITSTGKGLEVVIKVGPHVVHDWMAFLCWYSINKNIPDALIKLYRLKGKLNYGILGWSKKLRIPLAKTCDTPYVSLPCSYIATRPLDDRWLAWFKGGKELELWADAKSESLTTFCNASNWGEFVMSDWIDKEQDAHLMRFSSNEMTVNEEKIADLWQSASKLYSVIRR